MTKKAKTQKAPGEARLHLGMQLAAVSVLCVFMGVASWRLGDSFAYALDGLMSSASYWRLVLCAACLGWFVAAGAFWSLSVLYWRAGEREMGIRP